MSYPPQPPAQPPQQPPQYPPQYQQQGQYQQPYGQYQAPVQLKNNTLALVGFIMSLSVLLLMFIPFLNLLTLPVNLTAFILSLIGLNQIKKSMGTQTGRGFAIAGIVISCVFFALFVIGVVLLGAVIGSMIGGMGGLESFAP